MRFARKPLIGLLALPIFPGPPATAARSTVLQVSAIPQRPYIETREGEQMLNLDLLVHNRRTAPLRLAAIRERVFDADGQLELEKEINANGNPPALAGLGDLVVGPDQTRDFYQPFERYDPGVQLSRVQFTLVFLNAAQAVPPVALAGDANVTIDVYPRLFRPEAYCLPLGGRILVHDGHDLASHHRRRNLALAFDQNAAGAVNANLYAYDLVRIDREGRLYRGSVDDKRHWFSFGVPVRSPTDGIIVASVDGVPDNDLRNGQPIIPAEAATRDPEGLGNHVLVRGKDGRISWLLHLEQSSIKVANGEHVRRGQKLGTIGFSGDALFPHLHYTVTRDATYPSQGLPSYFAHFERLLGRRHAVVGYGQIDTGDILQSDPDSACLDDARKPASGR